MSNQQKILPFIHKKTKKILKNGKVLFIINKSTYLIEYNNKKYYCRLDSKGKVESVSEQWT
tara:strand:+ start:2611 stop:2793 length:183 start_codon:yes stop_codon:yes gene_type:complete